MPHNAHKVRGILDRLEDLASRSERVPAADVVEALGARSFGPFLLFPAILEISPVGAIPGVPTALAAMVVFFAVQLALGFRHVRIPGFVGRRSVSSAKVTRLVGSTRPFGDRLDALFHGRLESLTSGPGARLAGVASIALALTVPPLEVVPFASTGPMAAIAAIGLGLLVRDGLLVILAGLIVLAAVGVGTGVMVL